ncbi:hypothetical protein [Rufibacter tibetensis]|uniref:Uncharacterized protein n=1 Tax=Rufibacter tibetensis TaxID=512763 RepID=A0A0P0C2Z1_9BACT|nr:hypothetical protein [Rufibacter tibetensis]ALI99084.1 hypothetical protein DC20_08990 [Rufibacter tibetensis]
MKGLLTLCFSIFLLVASCQKKPVPKEAGSPRAELSRVSSKQLSSPLLAEYGQFLTSLDSAKVENVSKAAAKYVALFEGQPQSFADSGYVLFDRFFLRVDNTINEVHANDTTDYDPLVTKTKEPIPKQLLEYNRIAKANGFELAMTEGMTYLNQDRDFIAKNFYPSISPTLKEYLVQLNKENKEGFSEDGGLTTTPTQLADRVVWWENFTQEHPDFIFIKEARMISEDYLTYFLIGMDNTPVLIFGGNKLDPEFDRAYRHLLKKAPNSKASKAVQPYFKALQKSDTVSANALLKQYQQAGIIYNPYKRCFIFSKNKDAGNKRFRHLFYKTT